MSVAYVVAAVSVAAVAGLASPAQSTLLGATGKPLAVFERRDTAETSVQGGTPARGQATLNWMGVESTCTPE